MFSVAFHVDYLPKTHTAISSFGNNHNCLTSVDQYMTCFKMLMVGHLGSMLINTDCSI